MRKKVSGKRVSRSRGRVGSRWLRVTLVAVAAILLIFFIYFFFLNRFFSAPGGSFGGVSDVPRAAVLDGLYRVKPNSEFTEKLVNLLGKMGFRVDLFQGENVTIGLLQDIGGYNLLILRLHSALSAQGRLHLFSGERYTPTRYVLEQLLGTVNMGYTFNASEPPYFTLSSDFLGVKREGSLNGSIIVLMGCNGTSDTLFVRRLLKDGVKAYIAWDGYVDLSYSDKVTLKLIEYMYLEKLSPKEAIKKVMEEYDSDPFYGSKLECYTPK